jgi:hypothetical protein
MAYTTKTLVRENLLEKREFLSGNTGTTLLLGDNYTEAVSLMKKNGSTISTGWTFTPPNLLTFSTGLVTSDYLEVNRDILMSDEELDNTIGYVDSLIDSALAKAYTLPLSEAPKVIQTKATLMTQALVLKQLSRHPEYRVSQRELEDSITSMRECKEWFDGLVKGEYELVKADGSIFERKTNFGEITTFVGIDDSTSAV